MHPVLKRLLAEKVRLFCKYCTLHGAYYLPKGPVARFTWGLIMAAGFALMGALSHIIWHKYSTDPTITVVESTYYQSDLIPFPAVMICDTNPVYGPNTENVSNVLIEDGYNKNEISEFYRSFKDLLNTSYVPPNYVKNMHTLLHNIGLKYDILLDMLKKPCNNTLVKCRWRSKEYDCSDMFREAATVVGYCCHFDMTSFKSYAPANITLKPGFTVSEGLELTVSGVKSYYNGTVTSGGVLMYVFDANSQLSKMMNPTSLAHSNYYDIDIELFVIDSSPEVKALPLKKRKCYVDSDEGISATQNCIAIMVMRHVVNYCRCLPFMYTAEDLFVDNYPNCTWEQHLCIISQHEIFSADQHSLVDTRDCYQSCDYAEYDPRSDSLRRMKAGLNDTYTKVAIAYATSTCMKYRREVIYTWDQMLANLGGIFGLCLGGSVISIIEIIWFLIDLLVTAITFKKPTVKIFVIEQSVTKKNDENENAKYKFTN